MLKNITQLEHIVAGKVFHFMCEMDSELPAVKEALCQFLKFVGNIEDQHKANQATTNAESSSVCVKPEVQPEVPKPTE